MAPPETATRLTRLAGDMRRLWRWHWGPGTTGEKRLAPGSRPYTRYSRNSSGISTGPS
jgi:hypothetical protein